MCASLATRRADTVTGVSHASLTVCYPQSGEAAAMFCSGLSLCDVTRRQYRYMS